MIGSMIEHYRIKSELGRGGMGVVYEAEDTRLGRNVALKFLPPAMARDDASLQRFQREARAASSLNHPGICTVHAIENHEGQQFIVMELLQGQTLAEYLHHEPLSLGKIVKIATQIIDALESAHAKGIVHRDLKPANIFINSGDQVKILDFGLAKIEMRKSENPDLGETAIRTDELTKDGSTLGTISYMSPEQARGQLTDSRSDLFSLGAVIYEMATGSVPFPGDASAIIYDAILNREPREIQELNPSLPPELGSIVSKALEKDRSMRYQTAADLKTDFLRLSRKIDSGSRASASSGSRQAASETRVPSIAVLYFENLSGAEDDVYLRDGVTEDIITELSKIKGLQTFSRTAVLAFRDKGASTEQVGRQLSAAYVLTGSIRRSGARLRINTQLVDTKTDFPLWSERYDREMKDVFELQDEIAHKIADALRITLTPQEQHEIAQKPTDNVQAYDLYLRAKSYERRRTRQDLEFALQVYENAISVDPTFALAHAGVANVCTLYYFDYDRSTKWMMRADKATARAKELGRGQPEIYLAEAWARYKEGRHAEAQDLVRRAIAQKPDCEGAYYLLARTLFADGKYQEVIDIADRAIEGSGDDYNIFVPVMNAFGAMGKERRNILQRAILTLENQLTKAPEDARARSLIASFHAELGNAEEARREMNFAVMLRPNDPTLHYNAACTHARLGSKEDVMESLRRAWEAGYRDSDWVRRDPDLELVRGEPDFDRLYPASS